MHETIRDRTSNEIFMHAPPFFHSRSLSQLYMHIYAYNIDIQNWIIIIREIIDLEL